MSLFPNYPYTNLHELNLDWLIKKMNGLLEEWSGLDVTVTEKLKEMLESGELAGVIAEEIAPIKDAIAHSYLAEGSHIMVVSPSAGAQYHTINEAITAARAVATSEHRVTLLIFPGEYDEEIILMPNPGIDMIGIGMPKVHHASVYPDTPLHTTGTGYFEGIWFVAEGSQQAYALHIDAQEENSPGLITLKDCKFHSTANSGAGVGLGTNVEVDFIGCEFTSTVANGLYVHNHPSSGINQTMRVKDCTFYAPQGKSIRADDACLMAGGAVGNSYFSVYVDGCYGLNNNVELRYGSGGDAYKYWKSGVTNMVVPTMNVCRGLPGADYALRSKTYTQDVYFSGNYGTLAMPDEFARAYTVSAVNPLNSATVLVQCTPADGTLNFYAPTWSGGALRLTITGTIDIA